MPARGRAPQGCSTGSGATTRSSSTPRARCDCASFVPTPLRRSWHTRRARQAGRERSAANLVVVLRGRVRRDPAIGPLAYDEQHIVIVHEDQRPLSGGSLVSVGYLLTNRIQLPPELRVETLPHTPGSSFRTDSARTPSAVTCNNSTIITKGRAIETNY